MGCEKRGRSSGEPPRWALVYEIECGRAIELPPPPERRRVFAHLAWPFRSSFCWRDVDPCSANNLTATRMVQSRGQQQTFSRSTASFHVSQR